MSPIKYLILISLAIPFLFSPIIENVLHIDNIAIADPGIFSVDIDYIVDPVTDRYWVGGAGAWDASTTTN